MQDIQIVSGLQNITLAQTIAGEFPDYIRLGDVNHKQFPSGEIWAQYRENIRGSDLFIIEPISKPANDSIMRLLIMIDAAKLASAGRITAVMPFYGYSRQERKDKSRVPISAKLVANLLEAAGCNRILTLDLHAPQIQGFPNIPLDQLYAAPLFLREILSQFHRKSESRDLVFCAPDIGAMKRAEDYCRMVEHSGLAVCPKTRINETEVITTSIMGNVKDKIVVLVDDIAESCSTIIGAAKTCQEAGAKKIIAAVTHGMFTQIGYERISADTYINEFLVTDSIAPGVPVEPEKIKRVSCARLFASAIDCIHNNKSVSKLFAI